MSHKEPTTNDDHIDSSLRGDESVLEFYEEFGGDVGLCGYEVANTHFVHDLKKITEKHASPHSKDLPYAALKEKYNLLLKELTEFIKDREEFGDFLDEKTDLVNGGYHLEP